MSLESCRDNIVYRLVSKAMNMELLKTIPSIDFLDMVVVFYIVVRKSEDGIGSIRINEELMEQWGLSVNELFQYAMENTQRIFPKKIRNMFSMISELIQEKDWELSEQMENEEHWQQPYIITNDAGINGAGAILYPDTLKETARLLGGDYYIIPSSIHEVLAVSKRSHLTKKELLAMVKDVNETAVAKDEILSNVIYDYSVHTERMCICSGF